MNPGNVRHLANAPIEPTPRSKHGAKLHQFKLDYYANPTQGNCLMLSWAQCDPKDVAFCVNEEQFIEVMRGLYARLRMAAYERSTTHSL